jgi:hypothetical protein
LVSGVERLPQPDRSAEGQAAESYIADLGRRRRLVDGEGRTERVDAVVALGFDLEEVLAGHEPSRHGDDVRAGVLDVQSFVLDVELKVFDVSAVRRVNVETMRT